jgi:hypothetical protein
LSLKVGLRGTFTSENDILHSVRWNFRAVKQGSVPFLRESSALSRAR